jgi:hypothetical protein
MGSGKKIQEHQYHQKGIGKYIIASISVQDAITQTEGINQTSAPTAVLT